MNGEVMKTSVETQYQFRTGSTSKGWPVIGKAQDFRRNPLEFLHEAMISHGDIVWMNLGPLSGYLLNHPDLVQAALVNRTKIYGFPRLYESFSQVIGSGLTATPDGPEWRRKRQLFQRQFGSQSINRFKDIFKDSASELVEKMTDSANHGTKLHVQDIFSNLVLKNLFRCLFGSSLNEKFAASMFRDISKIVSQRFWSLSGILYKLPSPSKTRLMNSMAKLDLLVFDVIGNRRQKPTESKDLLNVLLHAEDAETGFKFSDQDIRDELMTFIFAGYETTADLISWTFQSLGEREDLKDRLITEAIQGREFKCDSIEPDRFPLLHATLNEVLRLFPPAWIIPRQAKSDDDLFGTKIRQGDNIYVSPYALHRNPSFWNQPDVFDISRFLEPESKKRHRYAHIPFGAGPRHCIGNFFAMAEALATFVTFFQTYDFTLVSETRQIPEPLVTLHPMNPVKIILSKH